MARSRRSASGRECCSTEGMLRTIGRFVPVGLLLASMTLPVSCGTSTSNPDPVDTDGDGLSDRDELYIYGTSPLMADTDGDGWSDFAEVIDFGFDPVNAPFRFNPLIADLPMLDIVLTSPPLLTIEATDETGETFTVSTTRTEENTLTVTTTVSATNSESESVSTPTTVSRSVTVGSDDDGDDGNGNGEDETGKEEDGGAELKKDPPDGEALDSGKNEKEKEKGKEKGEDKGNGKGSVSETATVSSTYEPTSTVSATFELTESDSEAYSQALELTQSYAESHAVTRISGVLLVTASIQNGGDVAFRVTNLLLTATMQTGPSLYTPIGNLAIETPYSNFQPFSLAPGESTAPMNFAREALTLQAVEAIFSNALGLTVQLGLFEVTDATQRAYGFTIGTVYTKTAFIVIDYGGRFPAERYQVATKADPSRTSITVRKAFEDVMRIPYEASPHTGLVSVRDIGGQGLDSGHWTVVREHPNPAGMIITTIYDPTILPFDFGDIELVAGDVLRINYVDP